MLTAKSEEKIKDLLKQEEFSVYKMWSDSELFQDVIDNLAAPFLDKNIQKIIGIESRGFILGGAVAYKLKAGFIVARKEGRMFKEGYPRNSVKEELLKDYTGKEKKLEIENSEFILKANERILIVDDWFETGAQGHAVIKMIEDIGASVSGISIMFDDMKDEVRDTFSHYKLFSLIKLSDCDKSGWF